MMARRNTSDMQNAMVAMVLSLLILAWWQYFIEVPRKKAELLAMKAKTQTEQQLKNDLPQEAPAVLKSHAELLAESPRVRISSDRLHGSIALQGLHFDDLTLARYRETLDPKSPEVTLLAPSGEAESYFAEFGWLSDSNAVKLPTAQTVWTADSKELTPQHPVTLTWDNGAGDIFTVKIALDDAYMFTVAESVKDAQGKPVALRSYAYINRSFDDGHNFNVTIGRNAKAAQGKAYGAISHEGPLGVFNGTLSESTYKNLTTQTDPQTFDTDSGGWLGISDKYWLSAIIAPKESFTAHFSHYVSKGRDHFQTDYLSQPQSQTTLYFFAGAKELPLLDSYAARYDIPLFDRAVDFGWFYFLTKPILITLNYFYGLIGNFGVAILLLTVIVKLLLFPLASKSFKSMSQMKTLTPKMAEIRERCKDDKLKMNQEIMELYKREKINPAAGCLPLFIQIPVFFSLYKVLYVAIEMRHAPFFGWIHDLSAPDPTNIFTLFGLVHWNPPLFLHLGVWPIILCITMVIQQRQSPPPPDPVQAKMMKLLPLVFLFMFSAFPAGLVIYYCWSNTLTILQQWYIAAIHANDKPALNKGRSK